MLSKHRGGKAPSARIVTPVVRSAAQFSSKAPNESRTAISGAHTGMSALSATATAALIAKKDGIIGSSSQVPVEISSGSESEYTSEDVNDSGGDEDEYSGSKARNGGSGTDRKDDMPNLRTYEDTNSASPAKNKSPKGRGGDKAIDSPVHLPTPQDLVDAPPSPSSPTSPTFGDLIRAASPAPPISGPPTTVRTIDVAAITTEIPRGSPKPMNSIITRHGLALSAQPTSSLATVLTQALRTDDTDLLESCLQAGDLPGIRATIERLDCSLALGLLGKLAARIHRRPGRAGTLMTWVQWTLVAHGGSLIGRPEVVRQLDNLQRVLEERARGLKSLLVLKGKLDLLEAQMQLRRNAAQRDPRGDDQDAAGERDVIYVEGEEAPETRLTNGTAAVKRRPKARNVELADSSSDEDMHIAMNGIAGETDQDEDDENTDEEDDASDGDAVERSADEGDVDYDDVEESLAEDDDSDGEAGPPAKMPKVEFTARK